jgi:hypothetical protein
MGCYTPIRRICYTGHRCRAEHYALDTSTVVQREKGARKCKGVPRESSGVFNPGPPPTPPAPFSVQNMEYIYAMTVPRFCISGFHVRQPECAAFYKGWEGGIDSAVLGDHVGKASIPPEPIIDPLVLWRFPAYTISHDEDEDVGCINISLYSVSWFFG